MKEYFWEEKGIYYRANDFQPGRMTIVFIHGLSGSSSAWAQYEAAFGDRFNILCTDLRGHGKSRKVDDYNAYEIEKISRDIGEVIDLLNIGPFIVISHSFGTLVAVSLLRERPQGAVANIFLSPTFGIYEIGLTSVSRFFVRQCTRVALLFHYSDTPGRHVDYSKYQTTGDWSPRRIAADLPNVTVHIYLYCLDHIYAQNFDSWWSSVKIPTLIIHGTRDTISPIRESRRLVKLLQSARLVEIPDANHILPLNQFERTRDIIADFLKTFEKPRQAL